MRLHSFFLMAALLGITYPALGTEEKFTEACVASSNLEPHICACCAQKARARLSPLAFQFLIATLQDNQAAVDEMRPKLSVSESMQAGMFMVKTPGECAKELQGP
jgi:hypothetical protein